MAKAPLDCARRAEILALLERLHRHKDTAYGDAWRKRGEVIAIFSNLARKYDRLTVALDEQRPAAAEPLADTVADLCVYAGKYLTWIAEQHPADLNAAHLLTPAAEISDVRGPDALQAVLVAVAVAPTDPPADARAAWAALQGSFGELERGLMAQARLGPNAREIPNYTAKARLAWALVDQSAWLLVALAERDPASLAALHDEVSAMDAAASAR